MKSTPKTNQPVIELNETVTIPQAAEMLGVHVNTIRRHISEGKLTVVKRFGSRAFYIPRAEVDALSKLQVVNVGKAASGSPALIAA